MSGSWVLNTLCSAGDALPKREPLCGSAPGCLENTKGSRAPDGIVPLGLGALPPAPSGGQQFQPLPRSPRICFGCLPLADASVPGQPKMCSCRALESQAAVLGSGRLMETFIPISSSPSLGCLSRDAACSPKYPHTQWVLQPRMGT